MLLITVGYLALQNDMLLNGLLMVIGFSLFFLMSFTSLLLMPCRNLAKCQILLQIFWFSCGISGTYAASGNLCVTNHTVMPLKERGKKELIEYSAVPIMAYAKMVSLTLCS